MSIESISLQYNIPEYLVIIIPLVVIVITVFLIGLVVKIFEPKFKLYRADMFYGMLWRWRYRGDIIVDLWCYCPTCDSSLLIDDENCKATLNLGEKVTFFICNSCQESEIGKIKGGDRNHAIKVISRAILAKIRLRTFDIYKYK